MISCEFLTSTFLTFEPAAGGADEARAAMRIRDLQEYDRRRLLIHLLSLGEADRQMRFGTPVDDETITRYVQHIDFHRDALTGVQDEEGVLLGAGHLAFVPRDSLTGLGDITHADRIAEFGVSVIEGARRRGVGGMLFERAMARCRSEGVDLLYMPCLDDNSAAISLARKMGLEVREASARTYLKLLPNDGGIVFRTIPERSATPPVRAQSRHGGRR